MSETINLFNLVNPEEQSTLELVRVGQDEIAFLPFTAEGKSMEVHYCEETEIRSYVPCNEEPCCLCQIGRKKETRILLPVYVPALAKVGILPISRSLRPSSLLPQLTDILKAQSPLVVFARREHTRFLVSTTSLREDMDGGEEAIAAFKAQYEAGELQLATVFPVIANEHLAQIPGIARMLALKGITQHAPDQRT